MTAGRQAKGMAANSGQEVEIAAAKLRLPGDLVVPPDARGLVVFAHGSGSSRRSPRNRYVAEVLNRAGLATLLFDLLTADEHQLDVYTAELRFNIPLLAERLALTLDWVRAQEALRRLPLGLFGASTGAAAALVAAAARPEQVACVVSRGGRPDLAEEALPAVAAPVLLIVGGADEAVIGLNRQAAARLSVDWRLALVAGASHLFEEPGTLEQAAALARDFLLEQFERVHGGVR